MLQCCPVMKCGVVCIKQTPQKQDNTMDNISACVEFHCGSLMAKTFQNSKVSTVEIVCQVRTWVKRHHFQSLEVNFKCCLKAPGLSGVNKHSQWRLYTDSFDGAGLAVSI